MGEQTLLINYLNKILVFSMVKIRRLKVSYVKDTYM